jgi:ribosomal protein S18 acetylase RimI-like enzyme
MQAYAELVQQFKIKHGRVRTNCFLHPDALAGYIAGGRLRVFEGADILLILIAEEYCERLYYYSASQAPLRGEARRELEAESRIIAMDIVTRNLCADTENPEESQWIRSGFHKRCTYQRMAASAEQAAETEAAASAVLDGQFTVQTSGEGHIPAIRALWRQSLDPLSIARPDDTELRALFAAGSVRMIMRGGSLCAVMVSYPQGKTATIDHVAVHPSFRRQGLARALLAASIRRDLQSGIASFRLWVDRTNEPAIRLYRAFAFTPDETLSKLFVFSRSW